MFGLVWKKLVVGRSKKPTEGKLLSKEEYFDRVNYVRTVAGLRRVLAVNPLLPTNTATQIDFKGLAFGASLREAKRLLGKPDLHANKAEEVKGHEVLFYNSAIGSAKTTQCLHFLHGKFVLAQCIIKRSSPAKSAALLLGLLERYQIKAQETDLKEIEGLFPLCDAAHNRIDISQAFDLTITYATGDPGVLSLVTGSSVQGAYIPAFMPGVFQEQIPQYA